MYTRIGGTFAKHPYFPEVCPCLNLENTGVIVGDSELLKEMRFWLVFTPHGNWLDYGRLGNPEAKLNNCRIHNGNDSWRIVGECSAHLTSEHGEC